MKSMKNRQSFASIRFGDGFFVTAINVYQKRISPRKGWRCAHSVFHGGTGCSGFVKSAIGQHGWRAAWPLARARFRRCKLAARQLRAQKSSSESPFSSSSADSTGQTQNKNQKKPAPGGGSDCWSGCDPGLCHCASAAFDCGPLDSGCIDCTPCG